MSDIVTSLQNQRMKEAVKLRDRRARDKQQRIIIDGVREITRALAADLEWSEVFFCEDSLAADSREVIEELKAAGATPIHVSPQVLAKVAFGDRNEGVVAVAKAPVRRMDMLQLGPAPVVAVLEGVEKPGNVGAILRTADAAGISAVLLADPRTDLFNPNTIRASQGAVFKLPIAEADTDQIITWLRARQFHIVAARVDASGDYAHAKMQSPCAIVLGSEADGLTDRWDAEDVIGVRLPMLGQVDSLNVSVTAGVLFYEALRQRTGQANHSDSESK